MFDEDLSLFFRTEEFAVTVQIDGASINGILSDEFVEVNFVETKATTFTYRKADKEVAVDSLLVNGTNSYLVKSMQADGTGLMKLILQEQNG